MCKHPWIAALIVCATAGSLAAQTTRPATAPAAPGGAFTSGPPSAPTRSAASARSPAAQTQPTLVRVPFAPGDPDQLLRQLASPDWHVRRATQALLVRGGEDATPFIRALIARAPDDESRNNAIAAIAQIALNRKLGPSYITLHARNAAPAEVFAEISRQCFAPLPTLPENLWRETAFPTITLDADHESFWELLPKICRKLGVDFRPYQTMTGQNGGMRIMRTGGLGIAGISQTQGAFLIVANQVSYSRTRLLNGNAQQTRFGMNFSIFAEPKLNVLRAGGMVHVDQAIDDHGNSLAPLAGESSLWGGYMSFGGWSFYAPLRYPKNIGSRLVTLKGTAQFIIETENQKIDVPGLPNLRETTRTINGIQVVFQGMSRQSDLWRLRIHVPNPNYASPEWQQLIEGVETRLQVFDARGNVMEHRGMSSQSSNGSADLMLDFVAPNVPGGPPTNDGGAEPSRVDWDVPTATRAIDVPIDFKDLPLFDNK